VLPIGISYPWHGLHRLYITLSLLFYRFIITLQISLQQKLTINYVMKHSRHSLNDVGDLTVAAIEPEWLLAHCDQDRGDLETILNNRTHRPAYKEENQSMNTNGHYPAVFQNFPFKSLELRLVAMQWFRWTWWSPLLCVLFFSRDQ